MACLEIQMSQGHGATYAVQNLIILVLILHICVSVQAVMLALQHGNRQLSMQIDLHDQKLLSDKTKSQFFSLRMKSLKATCLQHTHTDKTHTVGCPLPQRQRQTNRLRDAQWDRREDTLDLKPWFSRQKWAEEKHCNAA